MQNSPVDPVVAVAQSGKLRNSPHTPSWRRGFVASVFALGSGTALAQLLLLAFAPVLTRVYSPAEFAVYALYAAAVSLLAPLAAGRFEWALMLPKENRQAANLFWLSVLLASGTSSLVALLIIGLTLGYSDWLGSTVYWASWIPAGMLALSLWAAVVKWQARECHFKLIARSEIAYAIVALSTQVAGGWYFPQCGGAPLILGHIVGRLASAAVLAWPLRCQLQTWRSEVAPGGLWQQGLRHWRFPVFSSGASVLGSGVGELPKIMLGVVASASMLGYYSLAMRALRAPMFMIGQAVAGAFFPHISRLSENRARSQQLLLRTCGVLALIGMAPALVIFFFGEPLFALAFGEQWRAAGSIARLLIPLVLAEFAFAPIHSVLQSHEKQLTYMIWQACFLAGTAAAFSASWILPNVESVVFIYSLMSACMFLALFALAWRYVRQIPLYSESPPLHETARMSPQPLAA